MSRFSARDALAVVVFIVFLLGGSAAGYIRWVRSRGPTGIARDSIDNSRSAAPPTKPAP